MQHRPNVRRKISDTGGCQLCTGSRVCGAPAVHPTAPVRLCSPHLNAALTGTVAPLRNELLQLADAGEYDQLRAAIAEL